MGKRNFKVAKSEPAPKAPLEQESANVLECKVIRVGKSLAEHWLKKNHPSNRNISWGQVEAFAADMASGNWKLTHQGVAFDGDGNLIDGQHRLNAIVLANVVVDLLVVNNPQGDYQAPINLGRKRTVATIQNWHSRTAAALAVLNVMERGFSEKQRSTMAGMVDVYAHHEDALHAIGVPKHGNAGIIAASAWAYPVAAIPTMEFLDKVLRGEMIAKGDPAWAFREWRERNTAHGHGNGWEMAKAFLNCLRFYVHGQPLRAVYVGEAGYRAFTTQRRKMHIPNTPVADIVPTAPWSPGKGEVEQ